ncbi:MAG: efflux RND transporter permease subunit [Kofleriaceae bacterium]
MIARLVARLARRASLVWLLVVLGVGLGVASLGSLPAGIYPEMTFPRIMVVARRADLPPDLLERQVTRPLEEAVAVVPGVRRVRSRTIRGAAELSIDLAPGVSPIRGEADCRAAVASAGLPADVEVELERVLPTSVPVATWNLTGADPRVLREAAERIVRPRLTRVPGVGAVELQGGREREVEIELRPGALAGLHLSAAAVADAVARQDRFDGVGRVREAHQTMPVVVDARPTDLDGIAGLPVARGPTGPVPLSAVADVAMGWADPTVLVAAPGGEAVVVAVARLPGASAVDVVAGARAALAELVAAHALPAGVTVEPVYDQAALVTESMTGVRDAILLGVALSLVVIGLFLRDLRAGLVAAVPVPLTLVMTFALMRWFGLTLDLMSLGGLAISIGLVIDDAIVVTEGMVHHLEAGAPPAVAAERGVVDLFAAVVGTTITTMVVFAPLAWLSGITGSFLRSLAATLCIAVGLSMVLSLTVAPLVARHVLRARAPRPRSERMAGVIRWLVAHRALAVAPVVVLALAGVGLAGRLATGFLPAMDEGAFVIDFHLPPATSLEETDRLAAAIDRVLAATPEVVTFTRRTGTEMGPATATEQNSGDVMVRLVARDRRRPIAAVIDDVRARLADAAPEIEIEFVQVLQDVLGDLAGNPAPIELHFLGDDDRVLEAAAAAAGARLATVPGLADLFDGVHGDVPMLRATVDRVAADRLALDPATIADELTVAVRGRVVAELVHGGVSIGVRVRLPDAVRLDAAALAELPVGDPDHPIALGAVVSFDRPASPSVLRRDDREQAVIVTAAVPDGDLGRAEARVRQALATLPLPPGVRYEVGGQAASARAARHELIVVGAVGALLVLVVLLVQLGSLRLALVVLFGAPLGVVGALAALVATDVALDVSSLTGCILLVGLVVKNGILLFEHALDAQRAGATFAAALADAAARRTRPILMTTCATVAGLAPLAANLGAGAALQRPLAIAVIGGLALSTVVTLVVLPGLAALAMGRR